MIRPMKVKKLYLAMIAVGLIAFIAGLIVLAISILDPTVLSGQTALPISGVLILGGVAVGFVGLLMSFLRAIELRKQ